MLSSTSWAPRLGVRRATVPLRASAAVREEEVTEEDEKRARRRLLKMGIMGVEQEDGEEDEDDEYGNEEEASVRETVSVTLVDDQDKRAYDKKGKRKKILMKGDDDDEYVSMAGELAELNMEHYDEDDEGLEANEDSDDESGEMKRSANYLEDVIAQGARDITSSINHDKARHDDRINHGVIEDAVDDEDEDDFDDDDDKDAIEVRQDDLFILGLRTEDDVHTLEVWTYECAEAAGTEGNLYVHHDILLPEFPLCLSWLGCTKHSHDGNYVAVGGFDSSIEVWNLDELDPVEPVTLLGVPSYRQQEIMSNNGNKRRNNKKGKGKKYRNNFSSDSKMQEGLNVNSTHTDAVMCLSWNREYRNVLASGSADQSILIWDVVKETATLKLSDHRGKVQACAWNPFESYALLSAGFDKRVLVRDARSQNNAGSAMMKWKIDAEAEACVWDPFNSAIMFVSCENGKVFIMDARKSGEVLFEFNAHRKETTTLSCSAGAQGLLATGSTDRKVKLWDWNGAEVVQIASQDVQVGAIFSAQFSNDEPFLIAAGGAKGGVVVWDTRSSQEVLGRYSSSVSVDEK